MTKLVGIVNITPDSFSDGGKAFTPDDAIKHIHVLIEQGADIIDIGAESTRPGATELTPQEEWERLEPILTQTKTLSVPVSIDTRHPETAAKAIELGARWINDVSGTLSHDMLGVIAKASCHYVIMHALSIPADPKQVLPEDEDPVTLLLDWLRQAIITCESQGIDKGRVIADPGIGFGKTAEQSLAILKQVTRFKELGVPLLVGHSRKSFLSLITDEPAHKRDEATCAISAELLDHKVDYLRVHAIGMHKKLLQSHQTLDM